MGGPNPLPKSKKKKRRMKVFNLNQFGGNQEIESPLSNWRHNEPKKYYDELVKVYGKPEIIVNQENGLCIWYGKDTDYFHHLELKDEYVEHCVPAHHYDFFYTYVKIYIPPEKFSQVMKISGSIGYDGIKKLLYARCGSIEANLATLATVMKTINDQPTVYSTEINNKSNNKSTNRDFIIKQIKDNQEKYKDKLSLPYFDFAFPEGCK